MRISPPLSRFAFLAAAGVLAGGFFTGTAVAQVALASADLDDAPTFYGDVLPILQQSCQGCHRPGEVAPMSLLTYEDAVHTARGIKRMVTARRMPPWTADSSVGLEFQNDRSLSDAEIATIVEWVDAGTPAGDMHDAPPPVEFVDGWQTNPDVVIETPVFDVPADGTVEYTYYIFPQVFEEDTWIKASEMRPSNVGVTHHLLAYVRPPGSSYFKDYPTGVFFVPEPSDRAPVEGETPFEWRESIGGYAPGQNPGEANHPQDQAVLVKAGSTLVFEMHYTTNGEATVDQPRLGLEILDHTPETRRMTMAILNQRFEIPPYAENHQVDGQIRMAEDATLLSLTPHMHLRGKAWEYRAVFPDGRTEVLLSTPDYDFNWQITHYLEEPLFLPAGTVLEASAWYDNSENNRFNPDPSVAVHWGDQSWEEMMAGFFELEFAPELEPKKLFGG